jgi:hypothetical protein
MIEAPLKKKRRRKRRKKGKSSLYFNAGTHKAIMDFQKCELQSEKEVIYVKSILPAFSKLVENLIFIHKFTSSNGSYDDLKNDCVTFLYETLHKFDPSRGTKAFSYFNVVAKNWLIIRSKKNIKNSRRHVSIDDTEALTASDAIRIENYSTAPSQDYNIVKKESFDNIIKMLYEIKKNLSGENELSCINAIITIFEKIDDIDLLNKRAVFVYLRDLSSLNPKQLSIAMSSIRKHYRQYRNTDEFDIFF